MIHQDLVCSSDPTRDLQIQPAMCSTPSNILPSQSRLLRRQCSAEKKNTTSHIHSPPPRTKLSNTNHLVKSCSLRSLKESSLRQNFVTVFRFEGGGSHLIYLKRDAARLDRIGKFHSVKLFQSPQIHPRLLIFL